MSRLESPLPRRGHPFPISSQPERELKLIVAPDFRLSRLPGTPLPPPYKIEAAIECEDLKITGRMPGLQAPAQDMRGFAAGKWSGEKHLWVQARSIGDFVELEISAPRDEPVAVALHATRSWDYSTVRLSMNGQPCSLMTRSCGQSLTKAKRRRTAHRRWRCYGRRCSSSPKCAG